MKRLSIAFVMLAAPALAECPGGADPIFACSLGNSEVAELCLIKDTVRLRMGADVNQPSREISMTLALMPYRSTGIARSGEDFSYATFYQGHRAERWSWIFDPFYAVQRSGMGFISPGKFEVWLTIGISIVRRHQTVG